MNLKIAKSISHPELLKHIAHYPESNDFVYPIMGYEGKDYQIRWFKDVGIPNPEWNASVEEIK